MVSGTKDILHPEFGYDRAVFRGSWPDWTMYMQQAALRKLREGRPSAECEAFRMPRLTDGKTGPSEPIQTAAGVFDGNLPSLGPASACAVTGQRPQPSSTSEEEPWRKQSACKDNSTSSSRTHADSGHMGGGGSWQGPAEDRSPFTYDLFSFFPDPNAH
jgi:hypothetical protein